MTLTARDIAEITRLLEDSSFDELELEIDGLRIHLRRSGAPQPSRGPAAQPMTAAPAASCRGERDQCTAHRRPRTIRISSRCARPC